MLVRPPTEVLSGNSCASGANETDDAHSGAGRSPPKQGGMSSIPIEFSLAPSAPLSPDVSIPCLGTVGEVPVCRLR